MGENKSWSQKACMDNTYITGTHEKLVNWREENSQILGE